MIVDLFAKFAKPLDFLNENETSVLFLVCTIFAKARVALDLYKIGLRQTRLTLSILYYSH